MGKILILTEKPSVARDIAKVLKCDKKSSACLEGSKYVIIWGLGHLIELESPEFYGKQYEKWSVETLPILPDKFELSVIKQTSRHFFEIKKVMQRKDLDELVIATDAGREGELVARWIIQKAGWRKPIKRLWISSQTDKAIREGFANLKPGNLYESLYMSAKCRAEADWLVGLNITRALTCKYNAQLSAGRVQTPTLNMIVQREEEIRKFKPKDYWTIEAKANGYSIQWQDTKSGQIRLFDKNKVDSILNKVKGQNGKIIDVKKEAKKELPPLAYDLTELQRDANRKYGYSAKQTLSIMQSLYESHKLVTYPRTDSRYITNDIVPTLPERLKSIAVGPYTQLARDVLKRKIQVTKRFVDNSKVTDHHAIIPTEQYVNLSDLNQQERHIYDLIIKRFIAVLNDPFEYEQTTVKIDVKGELFYAKGKIVKSKGWKSVYEGMSEIEKKESAEDEDNDQSLPELKKGEEVKILSIREYNNKTRPPARYNEATLLSAMEHPGKFIDDDELRETMDKSSGLGTPATRADIIEKLFNSFYMERKGKEIIPTSKGIQLVGLVPEDLKSPELTAKWEQQLALISKGKVNSNIYISEMKQYASKVVKKVLESDKNYKHDNLTREKCPECGKFLLDVNGKKGKMRVCQDRECGYRKSVSQISNARCPECHKKMEIRGEGENKIFACICGYRERMSEFTKRKSEKVNKKEVNNFLKKQHQGEQINSALADALAKWGKK